CPWLATCAEPRQSWRRFPAPRNASHFRSSKEASTMEIGQLAMQFQCSMMALVLISVCPLGALAQSEHSHPTTAQPQQLTIAQGALVKIVRDNTERFKEVSVAEAEGYSLLFGRVRGRGAGGV